MVKTLRSLIQEYLPLDLRFQIELLSRRRDLVNEEKPQELFKLLREFNIEDIVPLGPGTNRYAFKLHGFVIKVATDHDGKIDNLKEFKMAKRLYPYVTKTYEVSENGTLLVAEYIQPFGSYSEMCKYAEQIREILTKLSSVYLIGDVGITSKNYANWGLRIGTDDPVCLDFAYVYEISSELFICRHCKTNSMLSPNKDFTELFCPSPGCGQRYRFEDIRSRIGNDIHKHEIGDLSMEGYKLTESNINTELDETRSNYLARKKDKEKIQTKSETQVVIYEPFVMEHSPKYYLEHKEDNMNIFENSRLAASDLMTEEDSIQIKINNGMIIPAVARPANQSDKVQMSSEYEKLPTQGGKDLTSKVSSENEDGLAFSGVMDPNIPIAHATLLPNWTYQSDEQASTVLQKPTIIPGVDGTSGMMYRPDIYDVGIPKLDPVIDPEPPVISQPVVVPVPKKAVVLNNNFLNNSERAFSKLANRIGHHMHALGAIDPVRGHIHDKKMFPETFYKCIQNAVYRSLLIFCDFSEREVSNHNNEGTHKEFFPPAEISGMPYESTMIFVSRFWSERDINSMEEPGEIMIKYRDRFRDYQGLQKDWLPILEQRISEKICIDKTGAKKIVNIIASNWCIIEEETEEITPEVQVEAPNFAGTYVMEDSMEENKNTSANDYIQAFDIAGDYPFIHPDVAQNPTIDEEEYIETDEEDVERVLLSVEIFLEDDKDEFDIIRINTGEAYGPVSIPFYTKFNGINIIDSTPSIVDDRNGYWDWLIHMVPDMMFETLDPMKWLKFNDCCDETDQVHVVILEEKDNGKYIMGIYFISGIFIIDDEGIGQPTMDPDILMKLNKIVRDDIGYGSISHLRRSLKMEELIHTEEYVSQVIECSESDPDDFDETGEGEAPEETNGEPEIIDTDMTDNERAAMNAVLNNEDEDDTSHAMEIERSSEPERKVEEEIIEFQRPVVEPEIPPMIQQPGVFQPIRRKDRERDKEREREKERAREYGRDR